VVYYQSYEFNTVLEVEHMGFMFGKSSAEPSLKLHLLWLEINLNYSYIVIVIIQLFSMSYCIGSRCRRIAVLNRKVSYTYDILN
jgi:hypothetical protein